MLVPLQQRDIDPLKPECKRHRQIDEMKKVPQKAEPSHQAGGGS